MKPYNTEQTKKEEVREMFDNIAPKYDLLNHTLSMSIDRIWRRRVVRIVRRCRPHRILDVATGTGDLAIEMARRIRGVQVLGVDLSEGMLDVARRKVAARGLEERVTLEAGDAETAVAAAGSVDVVTVAFGVRNFGDLGRGLAELSRALRPGGTRVYSTCTFNRDEDEGALERMAAWAGDEIAESEETAVEDAWGIVCGRVGAFRTFRFYPHRTCGEGFFAAVARKSFDAGGRVRAPKARRTVFAAVDRKTAGELARWVRNPGGMRFAAVADTCYAWYAAQADAVRTLSEALPVIYSGVALGQVFKGVLKPDPALAFFDGLNRGALPAAELDDEETLRFLRRQDIAAGGLAEGMNLVCSRGRALGFAKRIGARVNNLYPNSLRIIKQ